MSNRGGIHSSPPGAAKELDPDDPMLLTGVALPGDSTDAMAEVIVEELLKMGFGDDAILRVFLDAYYAVAHRIARTRGESFVRRLISRTRAAWGIAACRNAGSEVSRA